MSRGGRNAVLHAGKSLRRALTTSGAPATKQKRHTDPRVREFLGERILDDYAQLRDHYGMVGTNFFMTMRGSSLNTYKPAVLFCCSYAQIPHRPGPRASRLLRVAI